MVCDIWCIDFEGVGGNLVAVQASRLSTGLHSRARIGKLPADSPNVCFNPFTTYFGKGEI